MTTFLLNKMCLENEKKIGKTSFYDIFSKNDGSIAPQLVFLQDIRSGIECFYYVIQDVRSGIHSVQVDYRPGNHGREPGRGRRKKLVYTSSQQSSVQVQERHFWMFIVSTVSYHFILTLLAEIVFHAKFIMSQQNIQFLFSMPIPMMNGEKRDIENLLLFLLEETCQVSREQNNTKETQIIVWPYSLL